MRTLAQIAVLGALALTIPGCGGGDSADNETPDGALGQSVNAADGINASADASGTTGSTTGDAGGPLNIAGDAQNDSQEANASEANAQ